LLRPGPLFYVIGVEFGEAAGSAELGRFVEAIEPCRVAGKD